MPTAHYTYELDFGVVLYAEHEHGAGELLTFGVVLIVVEGESTHTVRVWDNHQGEPHMHRYTKEGGKQSPQKLSAVTAQDGYTLALDNARRNYREIIESWRRS